MDLQLPLQQILAAKRPGARGGRSTALFRFTRHPAPRYPSPWGRQSCLMPNRLWKMEIPRKRWGGPPWSARDALVPLSGQQHQHLAGSGRPTGASAADQGVRPTIYAECAVLGKLFGNPARGLAFQRVQPVVRPACQPLKGLSEQHCRQAGPNRRPYRRLPSTPESQVRSRQCRRIGRTSGFARPGIL